MKNTDLHVKILLWKCFSALLKTLVLEKKYKIVVPLFGAALHQIKAPTFYCDLGLQRQC